MISEAVLQIAILFVPGILWAQVDSIYASRRKHLQFDFVIRTLIFGLISYVSALLFAKLLGLEFSLPQIDTQSVSVNIEALLLQLIFPLLASMILSVLWCYLVNFRLFHRFLMCIGASKSFGDQDVWEFTFNSNDKTSDYVNVRDYTNELVYCGYVRAWSGSDLQREILLANVIVYNAQGEELYSMPMMYLARDKESLTIEFPTSS